MNTVFYQKGDKWFVKSMAVLEILNDLDGVWKLFRIFKLLPVSLLERIYDFIARNRYGWFGKKNECVVPTPDISSRFLE